jgi:hypothetical protein
MRVTAFDHIGRSGSLAPRRALLAAACLVAVGCASVEGGTPVSEPSAHVVVEGPGDRLLHLPCRILGTRSGHLTGLDLLVAEMDEDPTGPARYGAFGGMSGAPVVTPEGSLLGAVHTYIGGPGSRVFGVIPAERLIREFHRARRGTLVKAVEQEDPPPPLVPGESVVALYIWGDLNMGMAGTACLREGRYAMLFGHGVFSKGECDLALARSTVLAVAPDEPRANTVTARGELIGSVVRDSNVGCLAVLGRSPDSVAVTVAVGQGEERAAYEFHLARDREYLPYWTDLVVKGAFSAASASRRSATATLTLVVDGLTAPSFELKPEPGMRLEDLVGQRVGQALAATDVATVRRIEVAVAFRP